MKRMLVAVVMTGLFGAAGLGAAVRVQAEGKEGGPLHDWMEKNMEPPNEKRDLPALAAALDKSAAFAPDPAWNQGPNSWKKIAEDGAAAARAGDFNEARKSCKSCHKAWRKEYQAKHKARPLPK